MYESYQFKVFAMDLEGNTGHTSEFGEENRFRRSSILKPSKPRLPLQDVNLGLSDEDTTEVRRRRVSFGVKKIKQFNTEADTYSICVAPEEEVHHSASSESSLSITASGDPELILGKSINGKVSVRPRQSRGSIPNYLHQQDTENIPVVGLHSSSKCNGDTVEPISLDMTCPVNNNLYHEEEFRNGQQVGKMTDVNDVSQISMELTMACPQLQVENEYSNVTKMSSSMSIASSCGDKLGDDDSDDSFGKRAYERSSLCLESSMDLTDVVSSPPMKKFHQSFSPHKPFPNYLEGKEANDSGMGISPVPESPNSADIPENVPVALSESCEPPPVLMPANARPSIEPTRRYTRPPSLSIYPDHSASSRVEEVTEPDENVGDDNLCLGRPAEFEGPNEEGSDGIPDTVPENSQLDETCEYVQALKEDLAPIDGRNLDDMCETSVINPVIYEHVSQPLESSVQAPVEFGPVPISSMVGDVDEKTANSSAINETLVSAVGSAQPGHELYEMMPPVASVRPEACPSPAELSIPNHRKSSNETLIEISIEPFSHHLTLDPVQPVPVDLSVEGNPFSAPVSHLIKNCDPLSDRNAQYPFAADEGKNSEMIPNAVLMNSTLEQTCGNVQVPLDESNPTDMCETSVVNQEASCNDLSDCSNLPSSQPAKVMFSETSKTQLKPSAKNHSPCVDENSESCNSEERNLEMQGPKENNLPRIDSLSLCEAGYPNGSSISSEDPPHSQPVIIDSSSKITSKVAEDAEDDSCIADENGGSGNSPDPDGTKKQTVEPDSPKCLQPQENEPIVAISAALLQTSISEFGSPEDSILDSRSEMLRDSPFQKSFEIPPGVTPSPHPDNHLREDLEMLTMDAFPFQPSLTAAQMETTVNEEPEVIENNHPATSKHRFVQHICNFMADLDCNWSEDTGDLGDFFVFEYRSYSGALLLNFKFANTLINEKTPIIQSYMSLSKRAPVVDRHCASFMYKQITQKWLNDNLKVIGDVLKVREVIKKKINSISPFYKSLKHFLMNYKSELVNNRLNFTFAEYHSITRFHVSIDVSTCNLNALKVHVTPDFGEVSEDVIQFMIDQIYRSDQTFHGFYEFITTFYINKFKEKNGAKKHQN